MPEQEIWNEIDEILAANGSVPQGMKDKLILAGLRGLNQKLSKTETRIETLEKYKPWMQAAQWVTLVFGASVLGLLWAIFTGEVTVIFP